MRPRFSVVIPTYDNAATISRCVASVLSQTFGALEVLIVDAGSCDSTLEAVRTVGDSRVKVLHVADDPADDPADEASDSSSDSSSQARARAEGFRRCRGAWTTTLDPSDEVDPTWLSRFGKLADRTGAAFVSCGGIQIFGDRTESHITPVAIPGSTSLNACLRSGSFTAPSSRFRRLDTQQLGDTVSTGLALLSQIHSEGELLVSTPEALVRWHEGDQPTVGISEEELRFTWAMQALDALARSPIPDTRMLARCATFGGEAATRLGRHRDARRLFGVARSAMPEAPGNWLRWAGALIPGGVLASNGRDRNTVLSHH